MIKCIRLVGCQSWEDCTIPLAEDRMNVLKADNNSGKSVLFKMLKVTACPKYYTPKETKKLIRNGKEFALILYEFTDRSIGACYVYPTKIVYAYASNGKDFEKSFEPAEEMIDKIGLIHNSDKFIANIIDMDQSLLLVDSNVYENYELLKLLTECSTLNELKLKLSDLIDHFTEEKFKVCDICTKLDESLKSVEYKDIEKMQASVDLAEMQFDALYKFDSCLTILTKVSNNWVVNRGFDKLIEKVDIAEQFTDLAKSLNSIVFRKEITESTILLVDDLIAIQDNLSSIHTRKKKDFRKLQIQLDFLEQLQTMQNILRQINPVKEKNFLDLQEICNNIELLHSMDGILDSLQILKKKDFTKLSNAFIALDYMDGVKIHINAIKIVDANKIRFTRELYDVISELDLMSNQLELIQHTHTNYKKESKIYDLLEIVDRCSSLLSSIEDNLNVIQVSQKSIADIENKIKENGEIFHCGRFGKVIYNGNECIHGID